MTGNKPSPEAVITILAAELNEPDAVGVRAAGERAGDVRYTRVRLSADELKARLGDFLSAMKDVVGDLPDTIGPLRLDTVTLAVEVSAKGTVSLLGTGGELAGKGGITFTLKRPAG
jgi:hypothetical protein